MPDDCHRLFAVKTTAMLFDSKNTDFCECLLVLQLMVRYPRAFEWVMCHNRHYTEGGTLYPFVLFFCGCLGVCEFVWLFVYLVR